MGIWFLSARHTVDPLEDVKYLVQFLVFPEGFTEGDTPEDAVAMAADVLSLLVDEYAEQGRTLPTPSPVGNNQFAKVGPTNIMCKL